MTNLEKYNKAFKKVLKKEGEELKISLQRNPSMGFYGTYESDGRIGEVYIMLDTQDVLHLQLHEKGKEILNKVWG